MLALLLWDKPLRECMEGQLLSCGGVERQIAMAGVELDFRGESTQTVSFPVATAD